jgi:hypothetical protein
MKFVASAAIAASLIAFPANARCFDVTGRIMVERTVTDGSGRQHAVLEETADAAPGEHLVFQFDYRNARPTVANTFVITNPIPDQLVYAGTDSPGEQVSVDGGRTYGSLADLKVADADGMERSARPRDVTHVRWVINRAMPTGTGGQLSFRAVMRDVNYLPSRDVQLAMR